MRVAVPGGNGKTARAVRSALARRRVECVAIGRAGWEDRVRRSGSAWTILPPGAYLQNPDLTDDLEVPYDVDARFGFADLVDVGEAAAVVLTEDGHTGATYELASRVATPAEHPWLRAMFDYYDRYGFLVGTRPRSMLLGRSPLS